MTSDRRRFLAPLARSGARRTWQTWPWWLALPLAAVFAAGALWWHASYDSPLRPDVGYVVSQTDSCRVGLAERAGAAEPDLVVSTENGRGSCTGYDVGERLYYDAGSPRSAPASSSGSDNGAVGTWALGIIAALLVAAAVHDVVVRRHRLTSGTAPASEAPPAPRTGRTPAPGSTTPLPRRSESFSTAADLVLVAADPTDETSSARLRPVTAGALLLDLVRGGHVEVTGAPGQARATPTGVAPPREALLRGALERLARSSFDGLEGRGATGRAGLAWLQRRESRGLSVVDAVERLGGAGDTVVRDVAEHLRANRQLEHRDRLREEVRAVVTGTRAPDERTGPLVVMLQTASAHGRLHDPALLPDAVREPGLPGDPTLEAIRHAITAQ